MVIQGKQWKRERKFQDGLQNKIKKHDVWFVPKLPSDLFSVRAGATKGNSKCWIRSRNGITSGEAALSRLHSYW